MTEREHKPQRKSTWASQQELFQLPTKPMEVLLEMVLWAAFINCVCRHYHVRQPYQGKNKEHKNRRDRPQNAICYIKLVLSPELRLVNNRQCLSHVDWRRRAEKNPIFFLPKKYYSYCVWMCESKGHPFLSYNQPLESFRLTQQVAGFSNHHASCGTGCQWSAGKQKKQAYREVSLLPCCL